LDLCNELRTFTERVRVDDVTCWVENYRNWVSANKRNFDFEDESLFIPTLREYFAATDSGKQENANYEISEVDGTVYFTFIKAKTTLDPEAVASEKDELYDDFVDFVKNWKATTEIPEPMQNVRFHGGMFMAWGASEREFLRGATSGMFIAIAFSFIIFLIATQNII